MAEQTPRDACAHGDEERTCETCVWATPADEVPLGEDWALDMERDLGCVDEDSIVCPFWDGVVPWPSEYGCKHWKGRA